MTQLAKRSLVVTVAGAIWAAFLAISYGFVRLVEAVEGDTSECSNTDCDFRAIGDL
jgi:hypothetical protein